MTAASSSSRAREASLGRETGLVLASAGEGIIATDRHGRITLANPAALELLGYAPDEVLGRELHSIVHQTPHPGEDCPLLAPLADGCRHVGEELFRRSDGTSVVVAATAAPIVEDGEIIGLVQVLADVSERVEREAQLRQAQKMEAVGRLAGGVAHGFNNLLTAISGYAQLALARTPVLEPRLRRDIEEVRHAADRAASLTQQLLAFGRRQVLLAQVLDLNEVIVDTEKLLARVLGEHIEIALDLQPRLGCVRADPMQLTQVLLNLAVNARDAMGGSGTLRLATDEVELDAAAALRLGAAPGEYVVLTVADTGCGMDAETKARLFEPFFTTKDLGRGTGLGLATVYGIVTQSDGAISVESDLGRGTTFRVYLPRTTESRPAEALRDGRAPRGEEKLLLVEDEEVLRRLLADTLRKQGYRVVVADSPGAALELHATEGRFDLLVTDVVMPAMNGRDLAERLRERDPGLKVLYVSGYAADVALAEAARDSCAFLQKPFSLDVLAAKVRALLDGGASIAAP